MQVRGPFAGNFVFVLCADCCDCGITHLFVYFLTPTGNQMRLGDPGDAEYRAPPVSYDQLARYMHGSGAAFMPGHQTPQMQEALRMAVVPVSIVVIDWYQ